MKHRRDGKGGAGEDGTRNVPRGRDPHASFYRALAALREEFHRIGRFDDAGAKLDELSKLLALKALDARHPPAGGRARLSGEYLAKIARRNHGDAGKTAAALHDVFAELVGQFPEEAEAFGPNPGLHLAPDDDEFARAITPLLESLPAGGLDRDEEWPFDGVNEAFGHFLQHNFHNRKEDAQYMTAPEVAWGLVEIAFHDLANDRQPSGGPPLVADPTCGVGSFLAAAYRRAAHVQTPRGPLSRHLQLFGQDKVDRMVRLASVNLRIFARAAATVRLGNSILPPSTLDDIAGRVDLILTNPPFGATFGAREILSASAPEHFPVTFELARRGQLPPTLDSEYLLLDRGLALLKPGGRLLMVVPDHLVSSAGFPEAFRLGVLRQAELIAVVDLPAETFAQAGTRTRTSVVYLRRLLPRADRRARPVFMATSEDLGFRVVSRAGACVKRITGEGDLQKIVRAYQRFAATRPAAASIVPLGRSPSVAAVPAGRLFHHRWTAGCYKVERLAALEQIGRLDGGAVTSTPLAEAAVIDPCRSQRVLADAGNRCISVLHVDEGGCIDLRAVSTYRPATACVRCLPGDVLLSRINPRIVRIAVVPATGWQLACSCEFAVLRSRPGGLSPWALALLLRSAPVQAQIHSLTSGTSSSHNPIRDRDLQSILIPWPKSPSQASRRLEALAAQYRDAVEREYAARQSIRDCLGGLESLFADTLRQGP